MTENHSKSCFLVWREEEEVVYTTLLANRRVREGKNKDK